MWNPALRKSMTLPRPRIKAPKDWSTVYGFAFDHGTNNYKVLRIVDKSRDGRSNPLRAELYNLQKGAWKTPRVDEGFWYDLVYRSHSFVNGASHWVEFKDASNWAAIQRSRAAWEMREMRDAVVVVCDMCSEKFRLMKLPDCLHGVLDKDATLVVSGGLLSLINYDRQREGILSCSVWLMKKYGVVESWTIGATIDLSDWGVFSRSLISFRNKEEIMFVTDTGMLVLFDLRTHRVTDLRIQVYEVYGLTMKTYKESLVLLDEDRAVSENWFSRKKGSGLSKVH